MVNMAVQSDIICGYIGLSIFKMCIAVIMMCRPKGLKSCKTGSVTLTLHSNDRQAIMTISD